MEPSKEAKQSISALEQILGRGRGCFLISAYLVPLPCVALRHKFFVVTASLEDAHPSSSLSMDATISLSGERCDVIARTMPSMVQF